VLTGWYSISTSRPPLAWRQSPVAAPPITALCSKERLRPQSAPLASVWLIYLLFIPDQLYHFSHVPGGTCWHGTGVRHGARRRTSPHAPVSERTASAAPPQIFSCLVRQPGGESRAPVHTTESSETQCAQQRDGACSGHASCVPRVSMS
jgi:hypothetical protein